MTDSLSPAYADATAPVLRVQTWPVEPNGLSRSLIEKLPPGLDAAEPLVWLQGGDGMVAWGSAWRFDVTGSPFVAADDAWRAVVDRALVSDEVRVPGSGLVAFGSFAFDPRSAAGSVLIVPNVLVGRRDGQAWMTTVEVVEGGDCEPTDRRRPVVSTLRQAQGSPGSTTEQTGSTPGSPEARAAGFWGGTAEQTGSTPGSPEARAAEFWGGTAEKWCHIVEQALARLSEHRDGLRKVVLARVEELPCEGPISPIRVLEYLTANYPNTWVFAVDGLIGATPELLVRAIGGEVHSRVLAGTRRREASSTQDDLANDPKELSEHRIAVDSVISALGPYCDALEYQLTPEVLELPNVWHLATDIKGNLIRAGDGFCAPTDVGRRMTEKTDPVARTITEKTHPGARRMTGNADEKRPSVLELLAALHPTAAVCGWPRSAALTAIRELEGFDRGRYAGPVGWVDASGDGEWGIALRCGDLRAQPIRIYAGCGIVPGSSPESEWAESEAKLLPMRQALANL